jgi:hypothetical protein
VQGLRLALTRPLGVFVLAVLVRTVMMVALNLPDPIAGDPVSEWAYEGDAVGQVEVGQPKGPSTPAWEWAYEQGAVSQAVLNGDGLSSPFRRPKGVFAEATGSTAWCGPVYPYLLAGAIRATGGLNPSTQWLVAGFHILLSAGIAVLLLAFARAIGRPRLGAVSSVFWAVHPLASYFAITVVWDSVLVAFLLLAAATSLVRAGPLAGPRKLLVPGLMFGLAGLVNPAPLALAPAIAWYLFRDRKGASGMLAVAIYGGCAFLVVLPWSIRNAVVLGTPNFKANLGVEMMVGNNEKADGAFYPWIHPAYNAKQHALYVELGEVDYGRHSMAEAQAWISAHPAEFTRLSLKRAQLFWVGRNPFKPLPLRSGKAHYRDLQGRIKWASHFLTGLLALLGFIVWRDRCRAGVLVRGALVMFPLVYYVTHVLERYRLPVEPFVVLMGSAAILWIRDRFHAGRAAARA